MGPGFSPLDKQLRLRPGSSLTPWLVDSIVRLGARMPFTQVPELLAHFTGVRVSAATVRRLTEAAGTAAEAVATQAVTDLERPHPDSPSGPAVQQVSVDGAMAPLVGGVWAEVKTLAVGTVTMGVDGAPATTALSYFSRLTDADTFGRLATGELYRRGTSTAGTVVAVTDGAAWCQGFIDLHRHDAVRILDFAHALEHLGQVARAVFGSGTEAASAWLGVQAHALRHGREAAVLTTLTALANAADRDDATRRLLSGTHAYLAHRRNHIRCAAFVAAGDPIWLGRCRKRQQPRRRGPAQGRGHALDAGQRQPDAGAADAGRQCPLGGGVARDLASAVPSPARLEASRIPTDRRAGARPAGNGG